MDDSAATAEQARVKLLTLLNVAATKRPDVGSRKRKAPADPEDEEPRDWRAIAKKAVQEATVSGEGVEAAVKVNGTAIDGKGDGAGEETAEQGAKSGQADAYQHHFGAETPLLTAEALAAVGNHSWQTTTLPPLGTRVRLDQRPKTSTQPSQNAADIPSELEQSVLATLEQYQDLWVSNVELGKELARIRKFAAGWLVQHIAKTRQRVVKNNDYLAHHKDSTDTSRETRDQGFTRPKVLVLLPFRSSALAWMNAIVKSSPTSSPPKDIDRFRREYSLPDGAVDKLAESDAESRYPLDHRETFKGNVDDGFRIGIKWTRKEIRMYSDFYQADLIVASPVGLRSLIEKDDNADFLSSVEIVIADQLDVIQMQNWDHVNFIFERLNRIPTEARGADFSRIKPWYLDSRASFLRQTILLSSFGSPETRSLFRSLTNVAGKQQWEPSPSSVDGVLAQVRPGIKQVWNRVESEDVTAEEEERWSHFKEETLTGLMRSAVASSGGTLIFVPSYLDFVRLTAHLKKISGFEFASISEYSTNAEISRARSAFFNGQVPYLVITERFHFYRRYKLRGAKTIVFYAPPEHAVFYAEMCEYPFLGGTVQPEEVSVQVSFSRWDAERVARIVGSTDAARMVEGTGSKYTFA